MDRPRHDDTVIAYRGGNRLSIGKFDEPTNRVVWYGKEQPDGFKFFCDLDLLRQDCALQGIPGNPCIARDGKDAWIDWLTRPMIETRDPVLLMLTQMESRGDEYPRPCSRLSMKIRSLFRKEFDETCERARAAFDRQDMPHLVTEAQELLRELPPMVATFVWCELTGRGLGDLERAKFMHRCLAEIILINFGVPVSDPSHGPVPQGKA